MSISPTKARHLRFLKNKQMRPARNILRRDDDVEDGEESVSSDSEDEDDKSLSTDTESSTASPSNLVTSSATATAASTSVSNASSAAATASIASPTSVATKSAAPLAQITGVPAEKTSSIPETSTVAAIVVAILGFVIISGAALWFLRRRRKNKSGSNNKTPSSPAQGLERDSKFWGGATTVGTLTEVNFPVSQIPASMQPGGKDYTPNNFPRPETSESHLSNKFRLGPQGLATQQPVPYQTDLNVDNAFSGATFENRESLTGESPLPFKNDLPAEPRASIATSVPHFRNVTSWARDQRWRTAKEDEPMPARPYYKI